MGLLRSVARAGARATGRALSAHVVPDSLIPSWKTRKTVSDGFSLLSRATRKLGKKKGKTPSLKSYKSPAVAGIVRPASKKPKNKFDKNGWSMGRSLPGGSDGAAFSQSSQPPPLSGLRRKLIDAARNPRVLLQMQLDELHHDYLKKKTSFLSKIVRPKSRPEPSPKPAPKSAQKPAYTPEKKAVGDGKGPFKGKYWWELSKSEQHVALANGRFKKL